MLKTVNRLSKDKHVKKALASGRAFFCPYFTIKFKPGLSSKRFTVIVSTKVSKLAVKRNAIKRVLREYLRLNLSNFAFGDYAIVVKPITSKLTKQEVKNVFETFLLKNRLIKNEHNQ